MAAVEHAPGKSIVGAETVSGQRNIRLLLADVDGCACRKLNPGILVMQFAQGRATKNVPGAIDGARPRGARRCRSIANAH
jgi:hypothetical protein